MKIRGIPLSCIAGFCLTFFYIIFTLLSIIYYPHPFSPFTTYLSDFGNMRISSIGSNYYNIGCILTGISVIFFYIGLIELFTDVNWRYLLILGQLVGLFSGIALILIGIYPEDFPAQHAFWSSIFFQFNFLAMLAVNTSLFFMRKISKRIIFYSYLCQLITLASFLLLNGSPIVEWFTVFSSIGYAILISLDIWWQNEEKKYQIR
ncbi:DUF998 domain-containing protein [Candidatus Bathyarchaeota archaeon]|nr:DUF998 domain-containing protein [Candidatus Bathyarchaeota archaeon]